MKKLSKVNLLVLFLVSLVLLSLTTSFVFAQGLTELPRNETLYLSWTAPGPAANFNLLSGTSYPFPVGSPNDKRAFVYETLFMYNELTGDLEPLVGESYEWVDRYTLKVMLNKAAHWNDGTPLTAEDVVYSYKLGKKYPIYWSNLLVYIEDIKAESPSVVIIELNKERFNGLSILDSLQAIPLHPKHIWSEIEKNAGNDISKIRKFTNENPVGSGPYKLIYRDDQKIIIERDDNYWGKIVFGKLPSPKYIVTVFYKDNASSNLAFRMGEVDATSRFIPNVWELWEDGTPIKTYLDEPPYYTSGMIASLFINLSKKGLDVFEVRKAIAMCIDYKKINEVAVTGYSADVVPGFILPSEAESKYVDKDAIKPYQWNTDVPDIDGANELLDSIGAKKREDGIRYLEDGTRLGPYNIETVYGWSDWQAACEIVKLSCQKIGIDVQTKFPMKDIAINDLYTGNFDMQMSQTSRPMPSQPWDKAKFYFWSEGIPPIGEMAFTNFSRFKNDRADEIIDLIPQKEDLEVLKELYTELSIIYLENLPFIPILYKPWEFYTVNESVWKGFPTAKDGKNISPNIYYGSGIWYLYEIQN